MGRRSPHRPSSQASKAPPAAKSSPSASLASSTASSSSTSTTQVIRPAKLWNDTETAPQNDRTHRRARRSPGLLRPLRHRPAHRIHRLQAPLAPAARTRKLRPHPPHPPAARLPELLANRHASAPSSATPPAPPSSTSAPAPWARDVLDAIDGGTGQLFAALPQLITTERHRRPSAPRSRHRPRPARDLHRRPPAAATT